MLVLGRERGSQVEEASCSCWGVRLAIGEASCVGCGICLLNGVGAQLAISSEQSTRKRLVICLTNESIG